MNPHGNDRLFLKFRVLCLTVLTLVCHIDSAAAADPLETVVHFSPACTGIYLGSPTLVRLTNGDLLVGVDQFGPRAPGTQGTGQRHTALLFRSTDDGKTWRFVRDMEGTFWANLFVHRSATYYLGCSDQYGDIVIRKSEDHGETWTEPVDKNTGVLFPAGEGRADPNYHCAPMPVLEHEGRLYRAFEDNSQRKWPAGFQAAVISADTGADLLKASSWRMSNLLAYDQTTDPPEFAVGAEHLPGGRAAGWLEGNIVFGPDGILYNILRVNSVPVFDRAALVRVEDQGKILSFDPKTGFIEFPGGMTKFSIRRDPRTGTYWTLANENTNPENPNQRNVLSVYSSDDLRRWTHRETLLEAPEDFERIGNDSKVGFQYVDYQFDNDDILYVSRTAYNGAHNYHDANYITFHRIEDFRSRYGSDDR